MAGTKLIKRAYQPEKARECACKYLAKKKAETQATPAMKVLKAKKATKAPDSHAMTTREAAKTVNGFKKKVQDAIDELQLGMDWAASAKQKMADILCLVS